MVESGSSSRPVSILLVDDRLEDLLALEVILEGPGVRLVKAGSGAEALRLVLQEDFGLILLDVTMPGMDGFEVAEHIKKRRQSRHVPIIFLTGEAREIEVILRAYRAGAVDFILKPIDAAVVRAKVSVFVEIHRRGGEIQHQADLRHAVDRERYTNLADAVPQIVWTTTPEGEASYFNRRWVDYTGASAARSLGQAWQSAIHPNDAQGFVGAWRRALAAGEPLRTDCRLRSALGSYRWHLGEMVPDRDRAGRLLGWIGTFTDVHQQKLAEEDRARMLLREQVARAEAELSVCRVELLAEASGLLTRSFDVRGALGAFADLLAPRLCTWCVIDVRAVDGGVEQVAFAHEDAALRGLGAELAERADPGDPGAPGGVAGVLCTGTPEVSDPRCDPRLLASALGTARVDVVARLGAEAYVTVPLSARGEVLGAMTLVSAGRERIHGAPDLALAVDLGQRAALAIDNARLYAGARQAIQLRDEFLSIASHELRTPLSALELQVQSLSVQLDKPEVDLAKLRGKASMARRQMERLNRLISEMLDVSRIEAGRLTLEREDVDLGELVCEVTSRFAGELLAAGGEISLAIDEGVVGHWDRSRLDQVVTNLIQNAIKYGEGKPIRVSLRRDPAEGAARAILEIEDRGIGISPADQGRIFERFERAVSARHYGGMGVGLFIVDQILAAHAGGIEVRSAPGEGSTFLVHLPLGARLPAASCSGTS